MKSLLIGFMGMVLARIFTNEILGLISKLSRSIVRQAVRRLSEEVREQYREEWLATLEYEGQDGKKFSELKAALEAWWGVRGIKREFEPEVDTTARKTIERIFDRAVLLFSPILVMNFFFFWNGLLTVLYFLLVVSYTGYVAFKEFHRAETVARSE